jgi:hypothetical protein
VAATIAGPRDDTRLAHRDERLDDASHEGVIGIGAPSAVPFSVIVVRSARRGPDLLRGALAALARLVARVARTHTTRARRRTSSSDRGWPDRPACRLRGRGSAPSAPGRLTGCSTCRAQRASPADWSKLLGCRQTLGGVGPRSRARTGDDDSGRQLILASREANVRLRLGKHSRSSNRRAQTGIGIEKRIATPSDAGDHGAPHPPEVSPAEGGARHRAPVQPRPKPYSAWPLVPPRQHNRALAASMEETGQATMPSLFSRHNPRRSLVLLYNCARLRRLRYVRRRGRRRLSLHHVRLARTC